MNDKLKEAIITIAEYDGWVKTPNGFIKTLTDAREGYYRTLQSLKYHTSADALLSVWRKVRDEYYENDPQAKSYRLDEIKDLICDHNLPAACELIAGIINELKQK